ncbi:MAG: gamma-glutamylcyclotransferase [Lautropia sp.]|nr:gamma-glutamylcyclotransferase [Lautropia sp.]
MRRADALDDAAPSTQGAASDPLAAPQTAAALPQASAAAPINQVAPSTTQPADPTQATTIAQTLKASSGLVWLKTPPEFQTHWAFAYGSLIWSPEFEFEERIKATIHGYHRAFCVNSHQYRGTPEAPGVVLGLDEGGHCEGIVYRLKAGHEAEILDEIYNREMLNDVYVPRLFDVTLPDGRTVKALSFVANRGNDDAYVNGPREEILRRLRQCVGFRGPNRDYALNTQAALRQWGIGDAELDALIEEMEAPSRG